MGSARNFPAAIAQVCLYPSRRIHDTRVFSGSGGSLRICASSSLVTRGFDPGLRYTASQRSSQANPREPVAMKAHCQPHLSAIQGTRRGVSIAPVFVPALKMPVASARSLLGNHSATALMAPGKFADPVEQPPRREEPDGVGQGEPRHHVAVDCLGPPELALQRGRQDPEHLAVDIVDGGDHEQQRADRPPVPDPPGRDRRTHLSLRDSASHRPCRYVTPSARSYSPYPGRPVSPQIMRPWSGRMGPVNPTSFRARRTSNRSTLPQAEGWAVS